MQTKVAIGFLLVSILHSPAMADVATTIEVTNSAELDFALAPENADAHAGMIIHVQTSGSPYIVSRTLVVPDHATLVGDGVMLGGSDGSPSGFLDGTAPTIRASVSLQGDLLLLYDGAEMRGLRVQDVIQDVINGAPVPRGGGHLGNLIAVDARHPGDSISVNITDCDIDSPSPQSATPAGPIGCTIAFLVPNQNLGAPPPPFANSVLSGQLSHSIIRTTQYPNGAHGEALFALSYGSNTQINLGVSHNLFIGGGVALSLHAGVSRPDSTVGSSLVIDSRANRYLFEGPNPDAVEAWGFSAGSSPPIPLPVQSTSENYFSVTSTDDVIAGYGTGILAQAGWRNFASQGPVSDNLMELTLRAMDISTTVVDLHLMAAEATCDPRVSACFSPGDRNVLRATLQGVKDGKSRPTTEYETVFNLAGEASCSLAGTGNQIEIVEEGL
jgi:hypothetical protein